MSNQLENEIENMSKAIKTDSYPMSIGELTNIYLEKDLIINPEYQRLFRWDISQQSSLIESILLGIPLPPIYVYQTGEGKWDLIDGQQRLSSIFKFMGILKDEEGKKVKAEALVKTKFLPALAGKFWGKEDSEDRVDENDYLTEAQRRFIKRSKIDIVIIDKASDKFAQYEMFQRLNTGGASLSPQEIRNCVLIMNNKGVYDNFKNLSNNEFFKKSMPISEKDEEQQGYMEQVVRYFILRYSTLDIEDSANYNDFLTNEIINIIDKNIIDYHNEEGIFNRVFKLLSDLLEENAFKKFDSERGKFLGVVLVGTYEVIIPGLVNNIEFYEKEENHEKLKELIKSIHSDANYLEAVKRGVRPVSRLKKLASYSQELFSYEN